MGTPIDKINEASLRDRLLAAMKATAPEPKHAEEAAALADEIEGEKQEKELQRLCEQELSRRGIPYLHLSHRAREKAGWPDLVFPSFGRFFAVELKTKTGKLSKDQKRVMQGLEHHDALCAVVRSHRELVQLLDAEVDVAREWAE